MAKFVWNQQGTAKYNISNVSHFFVDVTSVQGIIPGINVVTFFTGGSSDEAKKFIDEITASDVDTDVDKFDVPLMATFMQYVQSLMPGGREMPDIISRPYTKEGEEAYERVFGKKDCPDCKGRGHICAPGIPLDQVEATYHCKSCKGTGKA